jgi:integrase
MYPERITPYTDAAAVLLTTMPIRSAAKIELGLRLFLGALLFWGIRPKDCNGTVVLAYILLRCARPPGAPIPPDKCFEKRVTPSTAAGDVDAVNRAIALRVPEALPLADGFASPVVNQLLRAISARQKRLTTAKKPILFREVLAYVTELLKDKHHRQRKMRVRDAFALTLAFIFGLRLSELLALDKNDITLHGAVEVHLRLRHTKTRTSLFDTHDPFTVASQHHLLQMTFGLFNKEVGFGPNPTDPVFTRMVGRSADRLGRPWFTSVVRAAAADATPHSCRVGMATELHAARVPLHLIMAAGRWRSTAALLYILGNVDDIVEATSYLGTAKLRKVGLDLRRDLDGDALRWAPRVVAGDPKDYEDE